MSSQYSRDDMKIVDCFFTGSSIAAIASALPSGNQPVRSEHPCGVCTTARTLRDMSVCPIEHGEYQIIGCLFLCDLQCGWV